MILPRPELSLDALADHPELARQLPADEAFRLYLKAQAVAERCALAMFTAGATPHRSDPDPDELINAKEVARILHRSVSWVQQNARTARLKFCLVQSLGRGLLFSRRKIHLLITREVGQNSDDRTQGLRGVNSGRRPRRKGFADPPSSSLPSGESGGG